MFTGLLPGEHGVDGQDGAPFAEGLETLGGVLGRSGYRTAGFPANPNLHAEGWDRDFDVYHPPWLVGPHTLLALLNRHWIGTSFEERHRAPFEWTADRSTRRVFALARLWWRIHGDAPRFLFVNLLDPHYPYHPPEADRRRFLPDLSPEESYAVVQDVVHHTLARDLSAEDARILRGLYDAEVVSMDREIGRFVEWLDARGDLDDTILVITSDHGERLGERGTVGHLLEMDQHLLRVPLLVRFPRKLPPGRIEARARLDGLPGHILGLAGVETPEAMARTPLAGGALAVAQHRYFGWFVERLQKRSPGFDASPYRGDWTFVADPHYALLWAPEQGAAAGRLVDFRADPDLARDLSAGRPEVLARLRAVAAGLPSFGAVEPRAPDAALREHLRALGYAD